MTDGVYTEREWLRNGGGIVRSSAGHWGALCIRPAGKKSIHQNRRLHAVMFLGSLLIAGTIAGCFYRSPKPAVFPLAAIPASAAAISIRQVPGLTFEAPVNSRQITFTATAEELFAGKLLLLDAQHPLPELSQQAASVNIATVGRGMIPVNDLSLRTGKDMIPALTELFALLRENGAGSFTVWRGMEAGNLTREALLHRMQAAARDTDLKSAVAYIRQSLPTEAEWCLPFTVELRMPSEDPALPDDTPLEETVQGRKLLSLAWRCGFVRCSSEDALSFCFRYVGRAHATAMTYLDVGLSDYLEILHEKRNITIRTKEATYHIQCIAAPDNYARFHIPAGAMVDVSADNTGYAVSACTIENEI